MWKASLLLPLLLTSCLTIEEQRYIDDSFNVRTYTRAQVDALNAEAACKALARNLVQIARCEVRR